MSNEVMNNKIFSKKLTDTNKKRLWWACIILCTAIALFARLYKLDSIPDGLHVDEVGMAYDAWSLANYNVDRTGTLRPIYFNNYGNHGQSALCTYSVTLLLHLFGKGSINVWLIRLPMVIYNMLAFFAGIYLVKELLGKKMAMLGSFLLAIMPYFIMQCRFALDCNLLISMLTISLALFYAADKKGKWSLFILAGISFGITFYTYVVCYIPNTIILLAIFIYLWFTKKEYRIKTLIMYILIALIATPLLIMIIINQFKLPQINAHFFTIIRINQYNVKEWQWVSKNVPNLFRSIFAYDWMESDNFPFYGNMYVYSLPFIAIGIVYMFKEAIAQIKARKFPMYAALLSIYFAYIIAGFFMAVGPATYRLNAVFFPQFVMVLLGIRAVYNFLNSKKTQYAKIFVTILGIVYGITFVCFEKYYFVDFPKEKDPLFLFDNTAEGIVDHMKEVGINDKLTYFDMQGNGYMLYSTKVDPISFSTFGTEDGYLNYVSWLNLDLSGPYTGANFIIHERDNEIYEKLLPFFANEYRWGRYILLYNK